MIFGSVRLQRYWRLLLAGASLVVLILLACADVLPGLSTEDVVLPPLLSSPATRIYSDGDTSVLVKPVNVKIIAMVFFGRRDRVQMLHCYLTRNLIVHGGWLDEVQWVVNTDNREDLRYLHQLVKTTMYYKQIDVREHGFTGFGLAWSKIESDAIYVKIDDDVVFMADDTIPRIVTTKLAHPEYLIVSANMINSPLMSWVHYHMGAIHPYLPEYIQSDHDRRPKPHRAVKEASYVDRVPWRYTRHAPWEGPSDYAFSSRDDPPRALHCWRRVRTQPDNITAALQRSPIIDAEYDAWGRSLHSWGIAAQEHYSFLENLASDRLNLYHFSSAAFWLTHNQRLSINLIAVNSSEILAHLPMDDVDEQWLTVTLPNKIGKTVAVDTHALAAHFTFGTQRGLETTDLLGRYLDYAMEHVCM